MRARSGMTVFDGFHRSACCYPDHVAVGIGGRSYTYRELMDLVQGVWRALDRHAGREASVVGVWATQEIHTYAALLAILASGRAYMPLNPHTPPERTLDALQQAGVSLVVHAAATSPLQRLCQERRNGIAFWNSLAAEPASTWRGPQVVEAARIAYVLSTSGSTGVPKCVPISHRNLNAFLDDVLQRPEFGFHAGDRFLQMFGLTFDFSIFSTFVPLSVGAALFVPPDDCLRLLAIPRLLERERITVAPMVPSVLASLQGYLDDIRLPHLRNTLFCGEALPLDLAVKWSRRVPGARLFNAYGPTEATVFCTLYPIPGNAAAIRARHGVVSVGRPMEGTTLAVVDDSLRPVADEVPGELCLLGEQVADGYWRDAERTAASFIDLGERAYRTGDIVVSSGGDYFFCGRRDDQVKVNGYRVELGDIEYHARCIDGVAKAVACAEPSEGGSCVVHLFLVGERRASGEGTARQYRQRLAATLPPYMLPHRIHCVEDIPLSVNGKADRAELLRAYGAPSRAVSAR